MRYRSVFGDDPNDPDEDVAAFASDFDEDHPRVTYSWDQQNDPQTVVRPDDFPESTIRHCFVCRDRISVGLYCSERCADIDAERQY